MSTDPIVRLAAANPVPTETQITFPAPLRLRLQRRGVLAVALAAAIAVPAAFAGRLGGWLDFGNQGTPVATGSIDLAHDTGLANAMQELGFPSTMQRLGTVSGVSFYAARRGDGNYCFAIESAAARGVGCDLDETFPSAARPVMVFPPLQQFAGYAADGVSAVAGVDAGGRTVVSAPVTNNLFAATATGPFPTVKTIEALDDNGRVLATWNVPGR